MFFKKKLGDIIYKYEINKIVRIYMNLVKFLAIFFFDLIDIYYHQKK